MEPRYSSKAYPRDGGPAGQVSSLKSNGSSTRNGGFSPRTLNALFDRRGGPDNVQVRRSPRDGGGQEAFGRMRTVKGNSPFGRRVGGITNYGVLRFEVFLCSGIRGEGNDFPYSPSCGFAARTLSGPPGSQPGNAFLIPHSSFIIPLYCPLLRASSVAKMEIRPPSMTYPRMTSDMTKQAAVLVMGVMSPKPRVVNVTTL